MKFEELYKKSVNKNMVSWLTATNPTEDSYEIEKDVNLEYNKLTEKFIKENPEHIVSKFKSQTILPEYMEKEKIEITQKLWQKYLELRKNKTEPDNEYFELFDSMVSFSKKSLKYLNQNKNLTFMNDSQLGNSKDIKNIIQEMADISKEFLKLKPKNEFNFPELKEMAELLKFLENFEDIDYKISNKNGSFMTALDKDSSLIHISKNKKDLFDTSSSITHELGHALYQNRILNKNTEIGKLGESISLSLHESSSIVHEISLTGINYNVTQSDNNLYRLGTDKIHYIIHIYIRMAIEEMLFNDKIKAKDISSVWNSMVFDYIGISPKNDWEGFMQDVHWSSGAFGYFHSYAIGFLNAVTMYQEFETLLTDDWLFNVEEIILPKIKSWYGYYNENSENILNNMYPDINKTMKEYRNFIFNNFNYQ